METKFDTWRKCWEEYLLGSQKSPEGYYEKLIAESIDRLASLPLDYQGYEDESECTLEGTNVPFFGLKARAMAYRTKGSRYYKDPATFKGIFEELDRFYETDYYIGNGPYAVENWWVFEVGAPIRILDILVLLYDEIPDREEKITHYTDVMLNFKDVYMQSSRGQKETGANLMWKCQIFILIGILRHDQALIDWANEQIPTMLRYSHPVQKPGIGTIYDDGFYEDGSFIQHYMFAYTGGYGKHFLITIAGLMCAFRDQECLKIPQENIDFLFDMVEKAYLPLLYKGHMMDVCRGREPSRYWCQDIAAGSLVIRALLYLAKAYPKKEADILYAQLKEQLDSKDAIENLLYDFHLHAEYFVAPSIADRLHELDEAAVDKAEPMAGHFNFGAMCKPVHRTKKYALAISMYSKNIACYEKLISESNKFWHMSDGVTYLYTGDGNTYSGDFYATADMQRLPGTTVERDPHRLEDPYYSWYIPEARNQYSFAGGTTLDNTGLAGQQYKGQGHGKDRTLDVKKSWFMFEKEILCMGSGITSDTDNPVETTILNDRLLEGKQIFDVMSAEGALCLNKGAEKVITTSGIFVRQLVGQEDNRKEIRGTGYYFPEKAELHILHEKRTGTWNSHKENPEHLSENEFLAAWIEHGVAPKAASYAYVIMPDVSISEWEQAVEASCISIEENSESAHAAAHSREKVLGVNFWKEEPYTSCGITASTQASVLIKLGEDNEIIKMSVSDPTKSDRTIDVEVSANPGLNRSLDFSGLEGGTIEVKPE